MRRKADDWINATHILKAAGFDKPARTRILEREVQKGVHEKVQGGYGKYQGTWIPLPDGRDLAERNGVLPQLAIIIDYVAGDRSPPPAPKHSTSQSKPRAPRASMAKRIAASKLAEEKLLENNSVPQFMEEHTPDTASISESLMDEDMYATPYQTSARKRKREEDQSAMNDQEHQIWADALLDYFMLADSEDRFPSPPIPPAGINLDRPIDDKGHSALHWAAAMGDLEVVKDLIDRGARIDNTSNNLETPLMRAVMFTNNFDKGTMDKMIRLLQSSVHRTDWFGSTVFHHIAATTSSKNKYLPARYYMETIINALSETWVSDEITRLLNFQDHNLDTTIHIAARNGARKCVRSLLGRNVAVDTPNNKGETADDMIRLLNERRRLHGGTRREASSSPFGPDRIPLNGPDSIEFAQLGASSTTIAPPHIPQYRSTTANSVINRIATSFMAKCRNLASVYESEYEEKEAEAIENEQVVRKRTSEIDALSRQSLDAQAQLDALLGELGGDSIEAERQREETEVNALENEALSLLELEHRQSLRHLVTKHSGDANAMRPPPMRSNGSVTSPVDDAHEMISVLMQAQDERRQLTSEIVRSLSVAGLGEKTNEYKRLICGALNVREDEVQAHLDDIVVQLEEDKRERMVIGDDN
jgi:transcription factor MBP1